MITLSMNDAQISKNAALLSSRHVQNSRPVAAFKGKCGQSAPTLVADVRLWIKFHHVLDLFLPHAMFSP
jgi:hypothetical protein